MKITHHFNKTMVLFQLNFGAIDLLDCYNQNNRSIPSVLPSCLWSSQAQCPYALAYCFLVVSNGPQLRHQDIFSRAQKVLGKNWESSLRTIPAFNLEQHTRTVASFVWVSFPCLQNGSSEAFYVKNHRIWLENQMRK